MSHGWSEDRIELLRRLWADGLSASQCAAQLGCTRNSVIGKIHRIGNARDKGLKHGQGNGLKATPKPTKPEKRERPAQRITAGLKEAIAIARGEAKPARVWHPPEIANAQKLEPLMICEKIEPPPPPTGPGITLMELRHTSCRYPNGDPRDESFRYCGERRESLEPNRPYCAFHARIAYQPKKDRKAWDNRLGITKAVAR